MERQKRSAPLSLARIYGGDSTLLATCTALPEEELGALITRALSNRCKAETTRLRVCRLFQDFPEFALYRNDPLPFYGNSALPTVVGWLGHFRPRGETVPHLGRYCLIAFSDALGVGMPIDHPATRAAATVRRLKPTKAAPGPPFYYCQN